MLDNVLLREHMLGLRASIRPSLHFLSEDKIIYLCGNMVVVSNVETKKQDFIPGSATTEDITVVAVSAHRRLFAVAETGDKGLVTIYDSIRLKRKKMLTCESLQGKDLAHVSFSDDAKHCLVLGGAPDFQLILWAIDRGVTIVARGTLETPSGKEIYRADLSPIDSAIVCVTGRGVLRFFRVVENQFRPVTVNLKREPQNYVCHCWLPGGQVVIGTDTGDLIIVENFEVKTVLSGEGGEVMRPLRSILPFSKGVLCGSTDGTLRIYHKLENDRSFLRLAREFKIKGDDSDVTNIAVSPSEDMLVCSTADHQMYSLPLDSLKRDGNEFHPTISLIHGPRGRSKIVTVDSCLWRPIIATCGADQKVHIWNYRDKKIEIRQSFERDIIDVSLHPCGLQLLVCFEDGVILCSILKDCLKVIGEFKIHSCSICRFSQGGQYFAVVHNAFVQIYNSYTGRIVCNLRGHSMDIKSLCWKNGDHQLCTIGEDGVACIWDIPTGERISRHVDPMCSYSFGDASPDFSHGVIVTSEGMVRTLDMEDMSIQSEIDPLCLSIDQVVASNSSSLLFMGISTKTKPGAIRVAEIYSTPNNTSNNNNAQQHAKKEWQCHSKRMTCMKISKDRKFIFTASEDGSLCMFRIRYGDLKTQEVSGYGQEIASIASFSEEVFIAKKTLEDKTKQIDTLRHKVRGPVV